MESAVKTLVSNFSSTIKSYKQFEHLRTKAPSSQVRLFYGDMIDVSRKPQKRNQIAYFTTIPFAAVPTTVVLSDLEEDTSDEGGVVTTEINNSRDEIKININVPGSETQSIFDTVFSKMVAAAQPIPGFRRVKGGKTVNIPKEILMHILGPSKVNKKCIKEIINSSVAEYVEKKGLRVSKDLRVEQSYEDLEAAFQPGKDLSFDANVRLLDRQ
ncbi:hypothetical protein ZOSMA_22G00510 [Zostera marina]|uniref:peptidylprolyl isomerase n=1 Tax=Zostera marina TaxID=29655 RepID=A0A0K9PKK5_ZOSMR|nr:hypothetical protein ZOSMA_22G00510 [Zostera marina]